MSEHWIHILFVQSFHVTVKSFSVCNISVDVYAFKWHTVIHPEDDWRGQPSRGSALQHQGDPHLHGDSFISLLGPQGGPCESHNIKQRCWRLPRTYHRLYLYLGSESERQGKVKQRLECLISQFIFYIGKSGVIIKSAVDARAIRIHFNLQKP